MTIHKYHIATFTVLLGLACAVGPTTSPAYAADPEIISILDNIGQYYNINDNDDVILSFNVGDKMLVEFVVKPLGNTGDIAFIYSDNPDTGVNSLICRLSSKCRGKYLSSAIESYVNAVYMFKSTQNNNGIPIQAKEDIKPLIGDDGDLNATVKPANDNTPPANSDRPLVLDGVWGDKDINGDMQIITAYKNVSGRPIKAFRVTWGRMNDFDEVDYKYTTEFTGSSTYTGNNSQSRDHIVQPGETIYYGFFIISGTIENGYFSDYDGLKTSHYEEPLDDLRINKPHFLEYDKIIYSDK